MHRKKFAPALHSRDVLVLALGAAIAGCQRDESTPIAPRGADVVTASETRMRPASEATERHCQLACARHGLHEERCSREYTPVGVEDKAPAGTTLGCSVNVGQIGTNGVRVVIHHSNAWRWNDELRL